MSTVRDPLDILRSIAESDPSDRGYDESACWFCGAGYVQPHNPETCDWLAANVAVGLMLPESRPLFDVEIGCEYTPRPQAARPPPAPGSMEDVTGRMMGALQDQIFAASTRRSAALVSHARFAGPRDGEMVGLDASIAATSTYADPKDPR